MKEGIQIKESAIDTTRKRRRGGTNFTGSKQKHRNQVKRRERRSVEISESSKTAQAGEGKEKSTWRLECEIRALDLEPINEDKQVTADSVSQLGRSRLGATVERESYMGDCDSSEELLGFETDSETQNASGETVSY
jgi:hypothetical protein